MSISVRGLGFEEAQERLSAIGLDLQEFRNGIVKATVSTINAIAAGEEGVEGVDGEERRFSNVQRVQFWQDHVNLTGYIWFFDCKIWFDVKVDLNKTKRLHHLSFQSLGWDPPNLSLEDVRQCKYCINTPPIRIQELEEIKRAGRDVNARDSLPLFRYIFRKAPEVRDSIRPIVLRIHVPRAFTGLEVVAFLQVLNLSQVLWQREWKTCHDGGATLTMAATPSDDSWQGMVRLVLRYFGYNEFTQDSFFSLTAEGFVNFAGCRILLGRTFPFIITLDHEFMTVQKRTLAELFEGCFNPKIIVDSKFSSNTGETPTGTRGLIACNFDTTRLWCPNGASVNTNSVPIPREP
jgi:hypothetical protein